MRKNKVSKYFENNSRSKHFIEQCSWKVLKQKKAIKIYQKQF